MNIRETIEPVNISLSDFVKLIMEMNEQSKSCCIHFTSTKSEVGKFMIENGTVIFISFNNFRGPDALNIIRNLPTINYRITRFFPMHKAGNLPDTATIINQLAGEDNSSTVHTQGIHHSAKQTISSHERQVVYDILDDIAGPMAEFFMEDHVNEACSLEDALSKLATELSEEDMVTFRHQLAQKKYT